MKLLKHYWNCIKLIFKLYTCEYIKPYEIIANALIESARNSDKNYITIQFNSEDFAQNLNAEVWWTFTLFNPKHYEIISDVKYRTPFEAKIEALTMYYKLESDIQNKKV